MIIALKKEETTGTSINPDFYLNIDRKEDGTIKKITLKTSLVADTLIDKNTIVYACAPNGDRGTYYRYDPRAGYYKKMNDKGINVIVDAFIRTLNYDSLNTIRNISEITELIKLRIKQVSYDDFDTNIDIINFQNGILNLSTLELLPHSADVLTTRQVPCNWVEENCETPIFDKFLNDLTLGIDDSDDVKKMLVEFIGVTLSNIPGYKTKTSLLLYGNGNAGKTQYRNLISELVGSEHVQALELKDLDKDFITGGLYGKRMCGSDDMSYVPSRDLSIFKSIIGAGDVLITQKFKDSFTSKLRCVFINCANQLPKFGGDQGKHVYDRMRTVHVTHTIPIDARDPDILEKMLTEREGIVYKAIMALVPVIERDYQVTNPKSCQVTADEYRRTNDLSIEFYNSFCFKCEKSNYTEAEIRRAFKNWCHLNYNSIPQKDEFERSIKEYLELENISRRTRDGRFYIFDMTDEAAQEYRY